MEKTEYLEKQIRYLEKRLIDVEEYLERKRKVEWIVGCALYGVLVSLIMMVKGYI